MLFNGQPDSTDEYTFPVKNEWYFSVYHSASLILIVIKDNDK